MAQGDPKAPVENPVLGRPYVVIALDKVNYKVTVHQHARRLAEAQGTVDDMSTDPARVEYVIVASTALTAALQMWRDKMASKMAESLGLEPTS